jgi:hypothetical protein
MNNPMITANNKTLIASMLHIDPNKYLRLSAKDT